MAEHLVGGVRPVDMYRGEPNKETEMKNLMNFLNANPDDENDELWSFLCCQGQDPSSKAGSQTMPHLLGMNTRAISSALSHSTVATQPFSPFNSPLKPQIQHQQISPIELMLSGLLGHPNSMVTLPLDRDEDETCSDCDQDKNIPLLNAMESRQFEKPMIMGVVEATQPKRPPFGGISFGKIGQPMPQSPSGGILLGSPQIQIDSIPVGQVQHLHQVQHQVRHFVHHNPLTGESHHAMTSQTTIHHQQTMHPNPINILFHDLLGGAGNPTHKIKTMKEEIIIPLGGGNPMVRREVHHQIGHVQMPGMLMGLGPRPDEDHEMMFHPDDEILFHSNEHHDDMMDGLPHDGTEVIEIIGGPHPGMGGPGGPHDVKDNQILDAMIQALLLNHPPNKVHMQKGKISQTVHIAKTAHDPVSGKTMHHQRLHHQQMQHQIIHKTLTPSTESHPDSVIDGLMDDLASQVKMPGSFDMKIDDHSKDSTTSSDLNLDSHLLLDHHDSGDYPLLNESYATKKKDLGIAKKDDHSDDISDLLREMEGVESQSKHKKTSGLESGMETPTDSELSDLINLLAGLDHDHDQEEHSQSLRSKKTIFDSTKLDKPPSYSIKTVHLEGSKTGAGVLDSEFQRTGEQIKPKQDQPKDQDEDWEKELLDSFLGKLKKRTKLRHKAKKRAKIAKKKTSLKKSRKLRRESRFNRYLKEFEDIYHRNERLMKEHHFGKAVFLKRLLSNRKLLKSFFQGKLTHLKKTKERKERRLRVIAKAEKKLKQYEQELGTQPSPKRGNIATVKNGVSQGSFESNKRKALIEFRAILDKLKPRKL